MAKKEKKAKAKKEKAPKPAKKKKKKKSSDGGGAKVFFANHIEKLMFGLIGLLCFLLVWGGFKNRDGIESSKDPASLDQLISVTRTQVKDSTWEKDFKAERTDNQDYPSRAKQARQALEVDSYLTNKIFRPPISPPRVKRGDPQLLAARDLQVRAGYGLAFKEVSMRDGQMGGGDEPEEPDFGDAPEIDPDDPNTRPLDQAMGGGERGGGRRRMSGGSEPEGVYFVGVTALVPYREQLEKYQATLLNSRGSDPMRDVPTYMNWVLRRAEVQPNGKVGKFSTVASYSRLAKAQSGMSSRLNQFTMGGMGGEGGADDFHFKFRDNVLTSAVPNLETRNPEKLFIHDRIVELSEVARLEDETAMADAMNPGATGDDPSSGDDWDMGSISPDQGPGGRFPMEGGRRVPMMQGGERGELTGRRIEGGPMTRDGGGMSFGGGSGRRGDEALDKAAEYLMFRYVDQDVRPGTTYRYQLQLALEDPNNPRSSTPPSSDSLEGQVQIRLSQEKKGYRLTDPSEPSSKVRVRHGEHVLAGKVEPPPKAVNRESGVVFTRPLAEPTAMVMALKFDAARALDIPGQVKVRPGMPVDFQKEVWVPIPQKRIMRKEKVHFQLESVVLDIRGGDKASVDELTRPGELLIWDEAGNMTVISEVDDAETFAQNVIEPDDNRRRGGGRRGEGDGDGFMGDPSRRGGRRGDGGDARGGDMRGGDGGGDTGRRGRRGGRRGGDG